MRVAHCLTPPGRSAIATIAVSGFQSVDEFDPYFRSAAGKSLSAYPLQRIVFGNWTNLNGSSEELVVVRTSPSEMQIHCHGGTLPIQVIMESLEQVGFRLEKATRNTQQTATSLEEELQFGLLNAPTKKVANVFMNLLQGSLRNQIQQWQEAIEKGDFDRDLLANQITHLLATFDFGQFLSRPIRVVLAGLPNVGKSSINNQILGYDRSIILDKPGTTRDVVSERTTIDGWSFEFSDTAGLRSNAEQIEAMGIDHAKTRIQQADLMVLVLSAENGRDNIDVQKQELVDQLSGHESTGYGGPTITVINKIDLLDESTQTNWRDHFGPETAFCTAVNGEGIASLMQRIKDKVMPTDPKASDTVIFSERQYGILQESVRALESNDHNGALEKLSKL